MSARRRCRAICEAAASQVAEMAGAKAPEHAGVLIRVFADLQVRVLEIYVQQSGAKADGWGGMAGFARAQIPDLEANLQSRAGGVVEDLQHGVVMGKRIRSERERPNVNIHGPGAVAIDSPGSAVQAGRDHLSQSLGWDPSSLLSAFTGSRSSRPAEISRRTQGRD
jgi:hypothetical protein